MSIINASNISHSYIVSGRKIRSLKKVSLSINEGEFVAIIGKNGCGKSTLAKHINMLVPLQEGCLSVDGFDAGDSANAVNIRKQCGMVFQNPDNQFVSSIVEEDIKFGLKNYDLDYSDDAVSMALSLVGMDGFQRRNINTLSGGQKQRIALAGVLAIKPKIIILDESTTMLPPDAREEMLSLIMHLHKTTDITFIMITQYVEEATIADKVALMDNGSVVSFDTAQSVLSNKELLAEAGLIAPYTVNLYYDLKKKGIELADCPLSNERLVELLCQLK